MKGPVSKATTLTLRIAALMIASLSIASAQSSIDGAKSQHTLCAAANAIVSTQMGDGIMADLFQESARVHAERARSLGATDTDLQDFIKAIQLSYNSGETTWDEIVDLTEACDQLLQ